MQPSNMEPICVTFSVLNDVKFRFVRPEQSLNIKPIFVTFAVSSGVKSRLVSP